MAVLAGIRRGVRVLPDLPPSSGPSLPQVAAYLCAPGGPDVLALRRQGCRPDRPACTGTCPPRHDFALTGQLGSGEGDLVDCGATARTRMAPRSAASPVADGRLVGLGAWRSLVAHLNGVQEVERSNRSAPTTLSRTKEPPEATPGAFDCASAYCARPDRSVRTARRSRPFRPSPSDRRVARLERRRPAEWRPTRRRRDAVGRRAG